MSKTLARTIKEKRDQFIDNYLMKLNALKKAQFRIRQDEKTFACVAKDNNGLKFLYAPSDMKIGVSLNETGGWAYEEMNHFLEFVAARAKDKNAYFFDMGANIGTQTVYASRSGLFSKIFSIEAIPYIHELLTANIVLNDCVYNTTCFNLALGAENGREKFLFNPLNPGNSKRNDGDINCREIMLDVVKTSEFVEDLLDREDRPEVLVFWIDVEGMEEEIVLQLKDLCAEFEAYFCVEYNSTCYQNDRQNSLKSYAESRDELYLLESAGMQEISDLSQVVVNQDIVFSAKSK